MRASGTRRRRAEIMEEETWMTLRYALSRLARPAARRTFGRTWFGLCLAGACVTLLAFGARHLFFITTVWLVLVFAPVRIAIEVMHTFGPRLRQQLSRDLERREDRYTTREQIALRVEDLFAREVQMPRLAPPDMAPKVVEAAALLCDRALRGRQGPLGVLRAATTCAALLERWIGAIAAGEHAVPVGAPPSSVLGSETGNGAAPPALWDPAASIQEQWITLRAVAGLAALTKTLAAVYEDSASRPMDGGSALRTIADAAMDYSDQVGLHLEGPEWEDIAGVPRASLSGELISRLVQAWTVFCAAPQPAPRRLGSFVEAVPE
jgi:hypothetical protein